MHGIDGRGRKLHQQGRHLLVGDRGFGCPAALLPQPLQVVIQVCEGRALGRKGE